MLACDFTNNYRSNNFVDHHLLSVIESIVYQSRYETDTSCVNDMPLSDEAAHPLVEHLS